MLATSFRAHGGMPATPVSESHIGDTYIPREAREAGMGRYERDFATVQALGQGEFSSVWKVRSKADGTLWAVKKGKPYSGFRDRQRQLEEVAILRAVGREEHPNILRLADSWEEAGRLHIRTELAPCGDLAHFLLSVSEFGGLEEGRVWKMLAELTSALHHIHSQNVLHLDFKPSNILITTDGSLKVADFGLSVFAIAPQVSSDVGHGELGIISSDSDRSLGPSPVSDHEGDREYLCPEALNDVPPAPPADVFSLGIMTLEAALSVELPSNGEAWIKLRHDDFSDLDGQYAIRGGAKPDAVPGEPPTPVISAELITTIQHMMASNPAQRMTLAEVLALAPLRRAQEAMERGREEGGLLRGRIAGPALAEEDDQWTEYVLGGA
jgi:mitosis inhibitor protein kinase SWE1